MYTITFRIHQLLGPNTIFYSRHKAILIIIVYEPMLSIGDEHHWLPKEIKYDEYYINKKFMIWIQYDKSYLWIYLPKILFKYNLFL